MESEAETCVQQLYWEVVNKTHKQGRKAEPSRGFSLIYGELRASMALVPGGAKGLGLCTLNSTLHGIASGEKVLAKGKAALFKQGQCLSCKLLLVSTPGSQRSMCLGPKVGGRTSYITSGALYSKLLRISR